jgi:hypothetical protein
MFHVILTRLNPFCLQFHGPFQIRKYKKDSASNHYIHERRRKGRIAWIGQTRFDAVRVHPGYIRLITDFNEIQGPGNNDRSE